MLLGILAASILGNALPGRVGEGTIRQLEQVKIFNATPSFK